MFTRRVAVVEQRLEADGQTLKLWIRREELVDELYTTGGDALWWSAVTLRLRRAVLVQN